MASGVAERCTIQLSYAIGVAQPLSIYVDTHGTGQVDEAKLEAVLPQLVRLTPRGIREHLQLNRPIYARTSSYGHFGRTPEADGGFDLITAFDCIHDFSAPEKILSEIRALLKPDGTLFIGTGERGLFDPAQDLRNHLGKIIRIRPDGSVPADNPFVGRADARAEIWSYGHRNLLGIAFDAQGNLWEQEMGPKGGDEVNLILPGRNHGNTHHCHQQKPSEFTKAHRKFPPLR